MGVVPKGCTTTLEVTWGSEVCKHRPAASPAPCPDPRSWGGTNPRSGADTATAGLGKQTPPTPCSVTRNGMLCKDKEPLWNHECGWAPRHQVCVTEEHRAGGEAPSGPAQLRKARSRRLCVQRLREGRGWATQTSEGATKPGGRSV